MLSTVYWLLLCHKVKCSLRLYADTPCASYICITSAAAGKVYAQRKHAVIRKCRAGALGYGIFSLINTFSLIIIKLEDVYHVKVLVAIWLKWLL